MRYNGELEGDCIALASGPELLGFNWWKGRSRAQIDAQDSAKRSAQAASQAALLTNVQAQQAQQAKLDAANLALEQSRADERSRAAQAAAALQAAKSQTFEVAPVDATPQQVSAAPADTTTDQSAAVEAAPDVGSDYYGFDFAAHAPLIGVAALAGVFLLSSTKIGKKLFRVK
jgi:hypothetical protein